nr:thioredoxin family protein [uncultured Draconibacterium sp.]
MERADNAVSVRELANNSGKNMLLFFSGEWCVPCRIMKREVFADKEVMKAINSQLIPVMINVDNLKAEELVKQYKIGGIPITIFTDYQGKVLDYAVEKIGKSKIYRNA